MFQVVSLSPPPDSAWRIGCPPQGLKNSNGMGHYCLGVKMEFDLGSKASLFLLFCFRGIKALIAEVDCRLAEDGFMEELDISYSSFV